MYIGRILIISLFFLYSCSTQRLLERADKLQERALNRGAVLTNDTTYVSGDTIINTYWKDSILYRDRTITDTIYIAGEVVYITNKDKRIARRDKKREDRHKYKIKKKELNVEKAQAKGWDRFWWGLLIGLILGFVLAFLIRKYFGKLKSLLS